MFAQVVTLFTPEIETFLELLGVFKGLSGCWRNKIRHRSKKSLLQSRSSAKSKLTRFKYIAVGFLAFTFNFLWSCGQQTSAILQNITKNSGVDPYQAANFEEEFNFFALPPRNTIRQKILNTDDPFSQKPVIIPPPKLSSKQLYNINQLAKKVDQPLLEEAIGRSFSTPQIDAVGNIIGFHPSIFLPLKSVPAPGIQQPYQNGLARILPNPIYSKLAKRTFAISLINRDMGVTSGTAWILDFKKTADNSPPTHFFFATNAHIWSYFLHKNDANGPYGQRDFEKETEFLSLTHILPEQAPEGTKLPTTVDKKVFAEALLSIEAAQIRTVFMGLDFLKSSPADWTDDPNFKHAEEMADIAIFEVIFSPESLKNYMSTYNLSFEEAVEQITGAYHRLPASQQFHAVDSSQFFSNAASLFLTKKIFVLGYPASRFDDFIDPIKDGELESTKLYSRSLWVNKPKELWDATLEDLRWKEGWGVSASRSYRSFMHKPGIIDLCIIAPNLSYSIGNTAFFELKYKNNQRKRFLHYGLAYVLDSFAAPSGSSGSPVINDNFEFFGLHTASDTAASLGLVTALNSPGFNYSGYYGKYNLEAYDLIYGGFPNQKFSYKQALAQLYSPEFQTNIFPNGVK